ncbi:hypothetical protein KCH_76330 [Kitasatospora cheerisanensis KCTC 2395]|uniref:Uncharacterized protein n=1 Tax=Kitasatospora cheerisanensis KCTC 2395 TaxID=1348663 RepID=A0A066YKX9_9ACTN|nr:hypothetical protein KCH_76330 [Kitasatospora cheerisanensis KCTC 2395]
MAGASSATATPRAGSGSHRRRANRAGCRVRRVAVGHGLAAAHPGGDRSDDRALAGPVSEADPVFLTLEP